MKKVYVKPTMEMEAFLANEYVSVCGQLNIQANCFYGPEQDSCAFFNQTVISTTDLSAEFASIIQKFGLKTYDSSNNVTDISNDSIFSGEVGSLAWPVETNELCKNTGSEYHRGTVWGSFFVDTSNHS